MVNCQHKPNRSHDRAQNVSWTLDVIVGDLRFGRAIIANSEGGIEPAGPMSRR